MGFLDNLENSLKRLETGDERELERESRKKQDEARRKIYISWLGNNLRLEVGDRRLELRPVLTGVEAIVIENGSEHAPKPLDLEGDPKALLRSWLSL